MKIAYLILAHNNPGHLQRLIRALSSSISAFFIHIDRKSNLSDFSQVEAILILLRQALAERLRFDYFVLLSGVDYPLQPMSYIENFFENNNGKEFINIVQIPCEAAGKPISRLTTYKLSPGGSQIARIMRKQLVTTGVISEDRDYKADLRNLVPHGGSTWWALSREACEYIQSFVDNEPQVVNFFKHTVCPDESFFQTIIGNSPYKARTQRNLTYADWSGGRANPAYLTEKHLEFLTASASITLDDVYGTGEIWFARKFSDEAEGMVLRLDQFISEKEGRLTKRCT